MMTNMKQRHYTVTTIGLPVRKELLIKSLLRIVNGKTINSWSFTDESNADVAIFEFDSVESASLLTQSQATSKPRGVLLTSADLAGSYGDRLTLSDPIRRADLLALLDSVSNQITVSTRDSVTCQMATVVSSSRVSPNPFQFAEALHALIGRASRDVFQVETAGVTLHVVPAARALLVKEPVNEETLLRILGKTDEVRVTLMPSALAQRLVAQGAKPEPIDWLLWRLGLQGAGDQLLPMLASTARFALRRWPDFGRLKHDQNHMRMAAWLTCAPLSIDEVVSSAGLSANSVRAFINACALCDLIEVHPVAAPRAQPQHRARQYSTAPKPLRYAGIFKSIRSVLGLGKS